MPTDVIAVPLAVPSPRLDTELVKVFAAGLLLLAICALSIAFVGNDPGAVSALQTVAGP